MTELAARTIEADIHRLEVGLRQLKIQYDMFFNGALAHEPFELRRDIERIIQRYRTANVGKYSHRFHLNALFSRYNSYSELWNKTVRAREEGDRRQQAGIPGENTPAKCRISDPAKDQGTLRLLHAHYEKLSQKTGGPREIPFDKFVRGISQQAAKLRARTGCDQIELRVETENEKVRLKARPVGSSRQTVRGGTGR